MPELAEDERCRERFLRESELAALIIPFHPYAIATGAGSIWVTSVSGGGA